MRFDVLIKGGQVVDGTGAPPYSADVGLLDSSIAEVGRLPGAEANQVIDAAGLYVVPGFIDAHVHGDLMLLADPVHRPALKQGVTTYIIGQDGVAFAPASKPTLDYMRRYTHGFNGNPDSIEYDWSSVPEYLSRFDRTTALNVAFLIPNGNVRMEVMGLDTRPATDDELRAMRRIVREGLDAGAVGLSSGMDYIPSLYADVREISALCEELAPVDGVYVSHIRGYGPRAPQGVGEIAEVAKNSGAAVHISHYNGPAELLLGLVDRHRAEGVDLTFDSYPYLVGSTILGMVSLPSWVQEGGIEATVARLSDPRIRAQLHSEWFSEAIPYPLDSITLTMVANPDDRWAEGMNLIEASKQAGVSPGDFVCDVLVRSGMAVGIFGARAGDRTEADIRAILRHPAHMAGSDGIFCGSHPHPRGWGAFARYLGYHTRELGDYDWGSAMVHLAGHAARRYRLTDRGLIRPGFAADLAVFDPIAVTDRSTYASGRTEAEGVRHVFVNGTLALFDGEPTGATPGRALRRG
ncbi:N-acyl-D-amino-acid deacylase family protein [Tautonia plasticadhaerens]|uniref:N-acyl-D-glutamate deacylase n=1 Tax=Tautonia plasticadhaerens TaxID=2527974 RepID=A0A518H6Q4_9BACT|nr:D-aminoacylase [Tautonia plasticadhaerens]QDV36474.1 N-acyl-D-glutamate deacylase [Tautonia plasticadhaerens]